MAFSCLWCRSALCLFLWEKLDFFPITLKVYYRTLAYISQSVVELQVILQLFYSYVLFLCYKYNIVNQGQAKTLIFVMYLQNNGF